MSDRRLEMFQLGFELSKDRVQQIIRLKLASILNRFDGLNTGCGAVDIRYRPGSIEGDDRRFIPPRPLILKGQYPWPIGGFIVHGQAMTSCDTRLNMVLAELVSGRRQSQVNHPTIDQWPAPFRAVLFHQAKDMAFGIYPSGQACGVQ